MTLHDYLRSLSAAQKNDFAARVGVKKIYLHQIAGGAEPSPLISARIQRESDGAVSVYELRPSDAHEIWPQSNQPVGISPDADGLSVFPAQTSP